MEIGDKVKFDSTDWDIPVEQSEGELVKPLNYKNSVGEIVEGWRVRIDEKEDLQIFVQTKQLTLCE